MTQAETIKIGTRGSKLALWQANWVKAQVNKNFPSCRVELVTIKTSGDKILDAPLAKIGGKGLFVKEIEEALLDGRIDMAVHSMKDMPADIPKGLCIGAVPPREVASDAIVSRNGGGFSMLPKGARVGTSSLRRSSQLLHKRPDISIVPLRGNIDTRLRKLETEELDAVILAAAGLVRLGLGHRITERLPHDVLLPAVGQGALCIETRENDEKIARIVETMEDDDTRTAVNAERAFLEKLEGGCQVPMAAHATVEGENIKITGLVANLDGSSLIRDFALGNRAEACALGKGLAEKLLCRGARKILDDILERGDTKNGR